MHVVRFMSNKLLSDRWRQASDLPDLRYRPCGLGVVSHPWFSGFSHLYPRLIQLGDPGQFFPVVDVWILVLSKGHLQLLQLFVGEGGAVASPGGGGVRPLLPGRGRHHRGLTQGALPQRFPYVCFQQEENSCETSHGCFCRTDSSSCFLVFLIQQQPDMARDCSGEFHPKKRDYINFMAPTVVRQPESRRDLAAEGRLVRKRYQKRRDFTRIIRTIPNKTTNLTNW